MSIGKPNASVLPEPVFALPHTSRPARASWIVSSCTGKGRLMPWLSNASTSSGATPRPANVVPTSVSVVMYFLAVSDKATGDTSSARFIAGSAIMWE